MTEFSTTEIALLITTISTALGAILLALKKNIRRSSCCGSQIEFNNTPTDEDSRAKGSFVTESEPNVLNPIQPPNDANASRGHSVPSTTVEDSRAKGSFVREAPQIDIPTPRVTPSNEVREIFA